MEGVVELRDPSGGVKGGGVPPAPREARTQRLGRRGTSNIREARGGRLQKESASDMYVGDVQETMGWGVRGNGGGGKESERRTS